MRAQIRRLHTPDAESLTVFKPPRHDDFALLVQIIAGPEGAEGEESFGLEVVTPKALARRVERCGPVAGRHCLIVSRFDADQIQRWIDKAVAACTGRDWGEVVTRLARVAHWEFEDYSE